MSTETHSREHSAQHTPGPWVLDYDKGSTQDVLSLKHGGICTVRRAGRHNDATFAANARLIAAAPELLEALYNCTLLNSEEIGTAAFNMSFDRAMQQARAAIAKARGQS